jgi:hypothetical protein
MRMDVAPDLLDLGTELDDAIDQLHGDTWLKRHCEWACYPGRPPVRALSQQMSPAVDCRGWIHATHPGSRLRRKRWR